MSFKERFEQLKRFKEIFGFLFNVGQFDMLSLDAFAVLRQHCGDKLERRCRSTDRLSRTDLASELRCDST